MKQHAHKELVVVSTEFEIGLLMGLLVGEGHFGGDGRQPHVTLRMHVRHEAVFRWLVRTFPGGRLYGPYNHDGRHYFQWMARGPYLRDELLPLLDGRMSAEFDAHSYTRFWEMRTRYADKLGEPPTQAGQAAPTAEAQSDQSAVTAETRAAVTAETRAPAGTTPADAGVEGASEALGENGHKSAHELVHDIAAASSKDRLDAIFARLRNPPGGST